MLIAPELVIVWAARQRFAARDIADRHNYKDRGWTITHGFFASMGGFMLYDNNVSINILGLEELEKLESEEKIDWPIISKEEIGDKSKGDFVSKGFAVLQTTWFTVQCITRRVVGLNLTQLELATLAFAVLSIILYTLWWDKPLGVARSVRVHLRHPTSDPSEPPYSSAFARFRTYFSKTFNDMGLFAFVHILVIKPFTIIKDSVADMLGCVVISNGCNRLSVPTFYEPPSQNDDFALWIGLMVGILFGGIHCIAWFFVFPSIIEEYIWRCSAAAITAIPIIFFIEFFIDNLIPDRSFLKGFFKSFRHAMGLFWVVIYFASRIALLVVSLLALRSLPSESLLEIQWSTFIPHFF